MSDFTELFDHHYEILAKRSFDGNPERKPIPCWIEEEEGRYYLHIFDDCKTIRPVKYDITNFDGMECRARELSIELKRVKSLIASALE